MAPREPVSTSESAPAAPVSSLADLHLHTVYSDGMCSPEMLINAVVAEGRLRVIAITDHDTLAGNWVARDHLERFPELGERLELISGVEVSSRDGHILGSLGRARHSPGAERRVRPWPRFTPRGEWRSPPIRSRSRCDCSG
jgi:hypothetical protein